VSNANPSSTTGFKVSPDSHRVVIHALHPSNNQEYLHVVPLTDASDPALEGLEIVPPAPTLDIVQFEITPVGQRIVYLADPDTEERFELYAAHEPYRVFCDGFQDGGTSAWGP
jgi:hypothetical protein